MSRVQFESISEAVQAPTSRYFWVSCNEGEVSCGNPTSYFAKNPFDEHLTFDIGNNKVLANVSLNGSIKYLSFYRSSYPVDDIPGVWWHKDFSRTGPYKYSIQIGESLYDLTRVDWPVQVGLLGNIFPLVRLEENQIKITLLAFAPISEDGSLRPAALIYGLLLENCSEDAVSGKVILPEPNIDVYISLLDKVLARPGREVEYTLSPGEAFWVPTVITAVPGERVLGEVSRFSSLEWLNQTWSYFKNITGDLQIPDYPFVAEFLERAIHQCLECIGMTSGGEIAGSNWGTYPTTCQIWMKDMYYSYLPFFALEPAFFQKGILWFLNRSVRPRGMKFEGGVTHSLGNTLTPVVMAGLYYQATADTGFFADHPEVITKISSILDDVLGSRQGEVWLLPSDWISDGPSLGDYHTGSNVLAWFSFKSIARILREVYKDNDKANIYAAVADNIQRDLDKHCIVEGPAGKQYIEGVNADGSLPAFVHDGEESDTTLMAFYGYKPYDDPAYHNHAKVAITEANEFYIPATKGIRWEKATDATFPGYITGFASIVTPEDMMDPAGPMSVIQKLTDLDGSIWWWPYPIGGEEGKVTRFLTSVGKCGWASGVFAVHFISQILGLTYDAPSRTLNFRPFSPCGSFKWREFRLGSGRFSVSYLPTPVETSVTVKNLNQEPLIVNLQLPIEQGMAPKVVLLNGVQYTGKVTQSHFFDKPMIGLSVTLNPGEEGKVTVKC